MEAEIGTYSSEIVRLKELSKKVIEGASVAPAFVSAFVQDKVWELHLHVCVCVCVCVMREVGEVSTYFCDWPSLHATLPLSAMQDRLGVKGQMEEDIVEEEEVEVRTNNHW